MKNYVKIYEDFDPSELLDGFDIDILTVNKLEKEIYKHSFTNNEMEELLKDGEITDVYDIYNSLHSVLITSTSKYPIKKAAELVTFLGPLITLIDEDKIYPFIDIKWKFHFIQGKTAPNGKIGIIMNVTMLAKHQDFPEWKHLMRASNNETGPSVSGVLQYLVERLNMLYMDPIRRGFVGKYLNHLLAEEFAEWLSEDRPKLLSH